MKRWLPAVRLTGLLGATVEAEKGKGMSYEAWRISYQSSEQAARVAYVEWQNALEEVKKWKALADAAASGFEACQRRQERTERLAQHAGYCTEGDRCVFGGDTHGVRAGCANWVTPNALAQAYAACDVSPGAEC